MIDFFLLLTLAGWVACAIAGAIMAASRGHSGLLGLICGLIFGAFGLAIVATLRRLPLSDERRCDRCDEIVREAAKVCPHCGADRVALADAAERHRVAEAAQF